VTTDSFFSNCAKRTTAVTGWIIWRRTAHWMYRNRDWCELRVEQFTFLFVLHNNKNNCCPIEKT
jgi:hypothetical protein